MKPKHLKIVAVVVFVYVIWKIAQYRKALQGTDSNLPKTSFLDWWSKNLFTSNA